MKESRLIIVLLVLLTCQYLELVCKCIKSSTKLELLIEWNFFHYPCYEDDDLPKDGTIQILTIVKYYLKHRASIFLCKLYIAVMLQAVDIYFLWHDKSKVHYLFPGCEGGYLNVKFLKQLLFHFLMHLPNSEFYCKHKVHFQCYQKNYT